MAIAGFNALVTSATGAFSSSSGNYVSVPGIKSFQISDSRDLLDITDFSDSNVHARMAALRDIKVTLSGDYENTGTTTAGWHNIAAAYAAGNNCSIQVFTNANTTQFAPTMGFAYTMLVENIAYNATVEGKVEVSVSMSIDASSGTAVLVLNGTAPN